MSAYDRGYSDALFGCKMENFFADDNLAEYLQGYNDGLRAVNRTVRV